jgi:hypothetical protein
MTRSTLRFLGHYAEMLAVMGLGMLIFGGLMVAAATGLGFGYGEIRGDAPALFLTGMGISMTAPMVWWMNRRGHSWEANRAMALSMILPTLLAIVLLAGGAVTEIEKLLTIQHVLMFPGMFVAMLPYRDEFAHGNRHATA